ncbi:ESX-1 secretion-associated protein [Streptomyces sp. NBC_00285]|uniref:WXG100 family type VII secretion target n=1 Tax=Streptomyces sp. NBC_00285 TaxID=2975700 RepID=UPI002E2946D2|nr:ESX-1 secretion-associated protein [Streptomyces sp. NBC_00285]
MSGQFGVDPETLTDLAGRFDREAAGLAGPIGAFSASAAEIGQAFGLLGICDGATEKYRQLLENTAKALGRLPEVLRSDGDRLRLNVTHYKDSDLTALGYVHSAASGGRP